MSQLNQVLIEGNLCIDPILRKTATDKDVCNLRIASNQRFKTADGNTSESVCFVDVVVWGGLAKIVAEHKVKGEGVIITGRLDLQSWEKDNIKHQKHVVVAQNVRFLTSHKKEVAAENSDNAAEADVPVEADKIDKVD